MYKEFPYKMDKNLKRKLDLLLNTLNKKDIWILIDGAEGSGKTNTATYLLYYFHCVTGRDFTLDRYYFDAGEMFEWVKNNSNGLINWDEATLGGLSIEWWNRSQINLLKFAMVGRKKHHIFVMCIPRFDKLKEDLRRDRIHALIHMDLGKQMNDYGHFVFLTRRGIQNLNNLWIKKRIRAYAYCAKKYGGFFSNTDIPYVFPKLLNEEEYEKKKDKAIAEIGTTKHETRNDVQKFKYKVATLKLPEEILKELHKQLGIAEETAKTWKKRYKPLEKEDFKASPSPIINSMPLVENNFVGTDEETKSASLSLKKPKFEHLVNSVVPKSSA